MLGLLLYVVAGFVAAWVVVGLWGMIHRVRRIGEISVTKRFFVIWFILLAGPYIWVEVQTAVYAEDFSSLVARTYDLGLVEGDPMYYKVQNALGAHATLVLVSNIKDNWGSYRNVHRLALHRDREGWSLDSVNPVNTVDGDSAGFTIPPYW